jgi:hypothetical protein
MALRVVRNSRTARSWWSPYFAIRRRTGATTDEGSSMYEMGEPRPAWRHSPPIPRRPAGRPAAAARPAAGLDTRPRFRSPGSPAVSEVSTGSVSIFGGARVLTTWAGARTRLSADILRILWAIHRACCRYPLRTGACPPLFPHHGPQAARGVGLHRQPGLRRRAARRGPDARLAAVTDRVLTDAVSALMRHNGYGDEAPPCMRWRGLARSHSPARRSLSCRLPDCCPLPTGPPTRTPAWNFGFPCSPRFPRSPPEFRGSPRIGIRVRW